MHKCLSLGLRYLALWILIGVGTPSALKGQDTDTQLYSLALQGVSLQQALGQLIRESRLDLVYSRALIEGQDGLLHGT